VPNINLLQRSKKESLLISEMDPDRKEVKERIHGSEEEIK
jgi:hypothetical protein